MPANFKLHGFEIAVDWYMMYLRIYQFWAEYRSNHKVDPLGGPFSSTVISMSCLQHLQA